MCAGRPFFITIGVTQASCAPAAISAVMVWAITSPVASSTLVSKSCTGWPGSGKALAVDASPTTTCTTLGRPGMSAAACPVADRGDVDRRHRAELVGQGAHQGDPGRRGQLLAVVDAAARRIAAGEQFGDGRRRVGQLAVGRQHRALADGDRAADDALDAQRFQRGAAGDDVDDGVDRPDLVELDVVGGRAMHRSFDVGEQSEGALGAVANSLRKVGGVDQLANLSIAAVAGMVGLGRSSPS